MKKKQVTKSYLIKAPTDNVWKAITTPELIQQYYFGTRAESDWKKGSIIHYTGEWQGKAYHDKGIIREMIPGRLLTISHWSDRSGKPDIPENYSDHSYELQPQGTNTRLILSQDDNFKSEESKKNAWQHWDVVIEGMKRILEK